MLSTTSLLWLAAGALGSSASLSSAGADNALHPPARHPREPKGLSEPYRELPWNDVNFLSTSDTHGWLLGHQHLSWPEPNYSGDFGDLASFATHMRSIAASKGSDLLIIDAGDHHDGSGLVSSSSSSAARADEIFQMLEYDIMAIGNHELYSYDVAKVVYEQAKRLYLTSNVNITLHNEIGNLSVPIGARYRKFTTAMGRNVTAFGCIFNFQAGDAGLTIQPTSEMVKEQWFLDTIQEAPDYFVIAGHMPARGETGEFRPVFDAIRKLHPHAPIFIFGGHTHVRDCTLYDDRSIAIVPGRYMETVAFTSSNLPDANDRGACDIDRRYIDANRVSYRYHTKTDMTTFDTSLGEDITSRLLTLALQLNISTPLGYAPKDLYLARYPYGHPQSALTHFAEHVLPKTLVDKERKGEKRVVIGNAGSLRFDLFKGAFDRNDELTISPFGSKFLYTRLPAGLAKRLEPEMNRRGASKLLPSPIVPDLTGDDDTVLRRHARMIDDAWVERIYQAWAEEQASLSEDQAGLLSSDNEQQFFFGIDEIAPKLTPGYITGDACKGKGDDTLHSPLPRFVQQPDFIATQFPDADDDELIDVVSMDFALDDLLAAVHSLAPESSLGPWDFAPYAEGTVISEMWGMYAKAEWN